MALTKKKLDQIENMTSDIEDALTNASSPSAGNPFVTASSAVNFAGQSGPGVLIRGNTGWVSPEHLIGEFDLTPYLGSITTPSLVIVWAFAALGSGGSTAGSWALVRAFTPGDGAGLPSCATAGAVGSDIRQIAAARMDFTSAYDVVNMNTAFIVPSFVSGAWKIGYDICVGTTTATPNTHAYIRLVGILGV